MIVEQTRLVLLGTGTPNAEPDRAGSSLAVIAGGRPYLVDFGPGVVRRAQAACVAGIKALTPPNLGQAFLTHLHSDHTAGYADLILTPWTLGRAQPLQVYGPVGTQSMTEHLLEAYAADIHESVHGLEPANRHGYQVDAHEFSVDDGQLAEIYRDETVIVSAFRVSHGTWPAYGFRFVTNDRTIVISGDTCPTEHLVDLYAGCDILVHEVYSATGFAKIRPEWQNYHRSVHTSTTELAAIANEVRPELLVLVHQLHWGVSDSELLAEIGELYDGKIVSGKDLDVF
jgi:ribonuclease BN (tRNA processing enzyme)